MAAIRTHLLLWSALSGLLWAAAWPGIGGLAPLAFVAWLPLLHAERLNEARTGRRRSFTPYVLLAHFVWNITCSWWFFMVSEPLATRLISVAAPVLVNTLMMSVPWWMKRIAARKMGPRMAVPAFVVFWLAMERLHHGWDLQWPWFSLGNVFGGWPAWVQWYEWTGMLGGTLWILAVTFLIDAMLHTWRTDRSVKAGLKASTLVAGVMFLPLAVSQVRFHTYLEEGDPMEVVVVQPNVDPYSEKFGGVDAMEQLDRMLEQAAGVMTGDTRLVVLPETALQEPSTVDLWSEPPRLYGLWENDLESSQSALRIRQFQDAHPDVAVLAGMSSNHLLPAGMPRPRASRPLGEGTGRWYQSSNAAMFLPSHGPVEHYRKSKLVAGVEAMPFEQVLGRLDHLALDLGGTTGSLARQVERSVLRDTSSGIAVVPAICYESVFGEQVAAHVRNGGEFIAVITNDGWWGTSPGYHQHLTFSSLRAIETRRAVARSANTGISCFMDQRGVMHEMTPWWEPDARRATIMRNTHLTPFVRYGDVVGRIAVGAAALLIVVMLMRVARTQKQGR